VASLGLGLVVTSGIARTWFDGESVASLGLGLVVSPVASLGLGLVVSQWHR